MELQAMADLGTRLASGDPRAVEDVYETLGPRVLSYLRRLVPYDEAEDVLQRVLFEVWRSRDRFDPGRSLEAWVFAIARRRAIDHLRRPHHVTAPIELVRDLSGSDGREAAETLVWAREVRRCLDRLPAEQREVLDLAYFGGRTQLEIATQLGLPLGTVKAPMFRDCAGWDTRRPAPRRRGQLHPPRLGGRPLPGDRRQPGGRRRQPGPLQAQPPARPLRLTRPPPGSPVSGGRGGPSRSR